LEVAERAFDLFLEIPVFQAITIIGVLAWEFADGMIRRKTVETDAAVSESQRWGRVSKELDKDIPSRIDCMRDVLITLHISLLYSKLRQCNSDWAKLYAHFAVKKKSIEMAMKCAPWMRQTYHTTCFVRNLCSRSSLVYSTGRRTESGQSSRDILPVMPFSASVTFEAALW